MAELEAKTKTIGYLPMERVQSLKGWDEYLDKSSKLSILRTETQKAKNSVREALRERLDETGEIDFAAEGDRIRVFRVFRKQPLGRRTRSLDLSSSFRENNDPTHDLNPTTEELSANLDPVTERLLAMMKAKAVS
jgi:hypothetical protein